MADSFHTNPDDIAARFARLEARVAALERQLALAERASAEGAASSPARDVSGRHLGDTQPTRLLADPDVALPQGHGTAGGFDLTAEFDAIDARIAEQAGREMLAGRQTSLADIKIDSSLIDKAFERPPPEKMVVVSDLEILHPRILERVLGTWRTPELLAYLRKLIVDERGDRAGFSMNVMSDLLMLAAILEAPQERATWNPETRRGG